MECNFTYKHFKGAINLAKSLGFEFYSMHDFLKEKPKNKFIVMRHDVDLSLKHALAMAKAEKSLGINSTYFIRTDGIFSPFDGKNRKIIGEIAKLGHEIGYHYEIGSSIINFKKDFLKQKRKFESVLQQKIFGAALHKTKKSNDKSSANKLNFVEPFLSELDLEYDAYSDIFLKGMKYISDSGYRWREGCMCNHIKKEKRLCILTHPIWWSDTTASLVSIIEELFKSIKS